jgi:hypothetical protein
MVEEDLGERSSSAQALLVRNRKTQELVVMKRFSTRNHTFRTNIDILKRLQLSCVIMSVALYTSLNHRSSPHVEQLLGYSRAGSDVNFYITHAGRRRLQEASQDLGAAQQLEFFVRSVKPSPFLLHSWYLTALFLMP